MSKKGFFINKITVVALVCLVFIGCGSTRVYMGSCEYVKITVSSEQATMLAENLPEKGIAGCLQEKGTIQRDDKVIEDRVCVYMESSDEDAEKKILNNVRCVEVNFKKPDGDFKIISEVIIYPKRSSPTNPPSAYHEILFRTKGGLTIGTHRILVSDPLAFTFCRGGGKDSQVIEMHITHPVAITNGKLIVSDKESVFPIHMQLQILSQIISSTRKPIKVIFVKMRER